MSKRPTMWPRSYEVPPRSAARRAVDRFTFGVFGLALGLVLILLVGYAFLQLSFGR